MEQLRVVLADDHPFVLLGVRSALSAHPDILIVGEAPSPASLLHLLQTRPCDVLVTDLSMPEADGSLKDGIRMVQRIRQGWPALRVVILTSSMNATILRVAISDGAISVLTKAGSMTELVAAVRRACGERAYVSDAIQETLLLAEGGDEIFDTQVRRPLSPHETRVISLFVHGKSISDIARSLGRDVRAISRMKRLAMAKLGVNNDLALFAYVKVNGLSEK
ncbi:response regulator transcription factor [Paraburkholderia sp. DHOC27]|uniref:response regulator transcription factor n=1 Tax=Paraburkholderia sp. DHOC27 TaxID=2303330 RepID=UPI000E3EC881|nr:response regulator transcription factor [Paraburkholderia sp. DHOC27]RFU47041.1 DNA-binding response regulator [Paraburkholderia sp. DHOC27]